MSGLTNTYERETLEECRGRMQREIDELRKENHQLKEDGKFVLLLIDDVVMTLGGHKLRQLRKRIRAQVKSFIGDESGAIVSAEILLIATILVIGMVTSLKAVRQSVASEFVDLANAFSRLDQSYDASCAGQFIDDEMLTFDINFDDPQMQSMQQADSEPVACTVVATGVERE